ncbi:SDR family NAD(P)-dependent oxidoreductase [Acanthopleuribacter pedis]|uniref:SDR family NAD(P)-dependent oxidoreductase n=1 Tax=Acanthopleuribacter pedis TaxID=442870 RepID=A0A8J7QFW2_9BACT|nr:SDR family NAD(P)-dependent oxidoreductase [Acanthopleuribacter pedis]MBO1317798.1 SDR family NAD(P)-dependent oxidoreductase [Acanthopleuribacter pedis]
MNIHEQRRQVIERLHALAPEVSPPQHQDVLKRKDSRPRVPQPIAVIGLACRFPQSPTLHDFWAALDRDRSLIEEIPPTRFDWRRGLAGLEEPVGRWGGFLDDVRGFDSAFFKILPSEADLMDPRQRLLLPAVYQSLEDAGIAPLSLQGSRTGLFVGAEGNEYAGELAAHGFPVGDGHGESMLANRISHFFDWRGPSEVVNTLCSGAAVALHRAVVALRNGDIDQAVVGAVNLILQPGLHLALAASGQMSPEATVRSFGADARGFLRSEGVGGVVLKTLADAERDGDPIYAVIRHAAVNYNGRGGLSMAMPNVAAHTQLVEQCYREAGIDIADLGLIEAQGMGNPAGDMAEWEALNRALENLAEEQGRRLEPGSVPVSTLKPMLGHMHAASALGALCKIIRSLQTGTVHPILDFETAHPGLDLSGRPCRLQQQHETWRAGTRPRLAGLHSYGAGGNNAHLLIEEYRPAPRPAVASQALVLPLSAHDSAGLRDKVTRLAAFLGEHDLPLAAVAHTLQVGRDAMPERVAFLVKDTRDWCAQVDAFLNGDPHEGVFTRAEGGPARVADDGPGAARAWVQGAALDWSAWRPHVGGGRVHLPVHRFTHREHWFDVVRSVAVTEAAQTDALAALRRLLSPYLQLAPDQIDVDREFSEMGFDSKLVLDLCKALKQDFGVAVEAALFFDHNTPRQLAAYLEAAHGAVFGRAEVVAAAPKRRVTRREPTYEPIAVIGLAGRYPHAPSPAALWQRLVEGADCIDEMPADRWNRDLFEPDPNRAAATGKSYGKWGGFLDGVYDFDPLFFNMSPREAPYINPKERLFLQTAWHVLEDAATYPEALADERVGVFVGVTRSGIDPYATSSFSIANRVSYCFDFNGPSLTLDTACSSSLVAIHEACRHLHGGECSVALAGGVHVFLDPSHFVALSLGQFLSPDGRCKSFGSAANGMVPGEGVGAVLLKPLAAALRDGNPIHGVIRGSATNHGGKSNGFTVPSAKAHRDLMEQAMQRAGIRAEAISYVEAHGTGTALGDPVEVRGLRQAFEGRPGICALGSLKSNLGHLEAAAGVAGLTKVLLQLKHRELVPSLHAAETNPQIDFAATPFRVQQTHEAWNPVGPDGSPRPRLACLSSFGAGGSNAHLLIEEAPAQAVVLAPPATTPGPAVLVLSAQSEPSLREAAADLAAFLRDQETGLDLHAVAYTLQVGRASLEERAGLLCESVGEAVAGLTAFASGEPAARVVCGSLLRGQKDPAFGPRVKDALARMDRETLLALWIQGAVIPWRDLYSDQPALMRLPVYAFARERYRLPEVETAPAAAASLHPLLHENRSTLQRQAYVTHLDGDAFFLADHVVAGEKILPGVAYLEMARAALAAATDWARVVLRNVVWLQPLIVREPQTLTVALRVAEDGASVAWEVATGDAARPVVHCQGRAERDTSAVPEPWDGADQTLKRGARLDGPICYQTYEGLGMCYGPRMRSIETIQRGEGRLVTWLTMPDGVADDAWVLHPSLLDGALQSLIALAINRSGAGAGAAYMPFALAAVHCYGPCRGAMRAVVRVVEETENVMRCDLNLYDEQGRCQAALLGFSSRARAAGPRHPLVHGEIADPEGASFQSRFTGREWFLADHVVNGRRLLPGVAYLEMARAAGVLAGNTVAGVGNLVWAKAMVVEDEPVAVTLQVTPGRGHQDWVVTGLDGTHHAQGRLYGAAARPERPEATAVDALRARCSHHKQAHQCWGVDDAAAWAADPTGASFRALTALSYNGDEALADFRLPKSVQADRAAYGLHPSLLDVAFETVQFWNGFQSGQHRPWLPFSLEKLWVYDAVPDVGLVHMRPVPRAGAMPLFDLDICDPRGRVCVALRGYAAMPTAAAEPARPILATTAWRRAVVEGAADVPPAPRLVLLEANQDLVASLRAAAPHAEIEVLQASGNQAAAVIGRLQQLLQRLQEHGEQALWVVAPDETDPQIAAITALLKTWHNEHPAASVKLLLVGEAKPEHLPRLLAALAATPGREVVARCDAGFLHHQHLIPVEPEATGEALLDSGDVVWITGGLGGLGRIFARYLMTAFGARVVLSGRSPLETHQQHLLDALNCHGEVAYLPVDLADAEAVAETAATVRERFGRLDAVIHAAGLLHDEPLAQKSAEAAAEVLAPKVAGVLALDEATADAALKWMLLCSSLAGVICPPGQGDYAAANAYLDAFAARRNRWLAEGRRRGRTVAVNWPLWRAGGMTMDAASQALMTQATGLVALDSETGCTLLTTALQHSADHLLVLPGDRDKIRAVFFEAAQPKQATGLEPAPAVARDLRDRVLAELKQGVAELQQVAHERIRADRELTQYGFDSISFTHFANRLNTRHGLDLMPTVFFEYTTPARLADYLAANFPEAFQQESAPPAGVVVQKASPEPAPVPRRFLGQAAVPAAGAIEAVSSPDATANDAVAVIGMAGRFPGSPDLATFWDHLVNNRDLTREVPADRWDWRGIYGDPHQTPGKTRINRGGFIEDIACFDPMFFGISPREAEALDPQFRLFLETVWAAMNDAGVTAKSLAGSKTGVFAGVTTRDYQTLLQQAEWGSGSFMASLLCHFTVANRVSYLLDLRGASEPIDTACSSSLVAIHHAVEQIQQGKCEAAFAGGINLIADPGFMIAAGRVGMLSEDGRCKTFDAEADGFGRGEGVGVVLLKSLARALEDGDIIHGVIRATAENHGGKAASPTTPNPAAQQALLVDAYRRAGLQPSQIGYIETHGTGTKLGDPIEVNGLKGAYAELKQDDAVVGTALGSVKANVGHLEAAAGIVGVIKVLLMLKHGTIPGNIHLKQVNPYLKIEEGPFYLPTESVPWPEPTGPDLQAQPRCAGVSSFGIGGTNAHVVLEEAPAAKPRRAPEPGPYLFVLSALNSERLQAVAAGLLEWLRHGGDEVRLDDIAYTLHIGRDALPQRLAFRADSLEALTAFLQNAARGEACPGLLQGRVEKDQVRAACDDAAVAARVEAALAQKDEGTLVELWLVGYDFDWAPLYPDNGPRRISLPAYPFARQRYWGPDSLLATGTQSAAAAPAENDLLCFEETWVARDTTAPDPVTSGPVLWFLPPAAVCLALPEQHLRVTPGSVFSREAAAAYRCDLDDAASVGALFEAVKQDHGVPATVLFCLPPWDEDQPFRLDHHVHLIQALHATKAQPARLVLGGCYRNDDQRVALEALIGGARSTGALLPNTRVQVVLHDVPGQAGLSLLWRETAAPDQAVCYQEQQRRILQIREVHPGEGTASPLRTRGTYLITGGAGGLGLLFAKHLAARVGANLVLIGRSPLSPEKQAAVAQIETAGGRAAYVQGDVCDPAAMRAAVAEAKCRFGAVHGVIHAAGLPAGSLLTDKNAADVAAVLAPKFTGTRVLDQVLADEPLDFVVTFSSSSAVLGDFGAFDYAVANRYQSAYAAVRRGPGQSLAVMWPTWAEGGMRLEDADQLHLYLKSSGQALLTAALGLPIFERLTAGESRQVLVLHGEPQRLRHIATSATQPKSDGFTYLSPQTGARETATPTKPDGFTYLSPQTGAEETTTPTKPDGSTYLSPQTGTAETASPTKPDVFTYLSPQTGAEETTTPTKPDGFTYLSPQTGAPKKPTPTKPDVFTYLSPQTGAPKKPTPTKPDGFASLAPPEQTPVLNPARPELKGLSLAQCVAWDLRDLAARYLKMPRHLLGEDTNLADFGFDSIALADWARMLSAHFGLDITPSVFFGYATLAKLTGFFIDEHGSLMQSFYAGPGQPSTAPKPQRLTEPETTAPISASQPAATAAIGDTASVSCDGIAVIGMSGRFPQARSVDAMWRILAEGRNAVAEVPPDRFDWRAVFGDPHQDPYKTNGKWLGCVPGVAEFDPLFFEISPAEAERMDPRQRLLLQELWNALEDAGYGPNHLAQQRVGTFVGVEDGDYALATGAGDFTANHTGIMAARLAYFLDLKGPNMALNTACSSSLVALHQACQSLRNGECDTALAAGVNLVLAPQTLVGLGQAGMLSDSGTCFAFDRRADGMVPGEAAVAVVLKPLARALTDGDPIHGVIEASGINHDGRTNGITAPSGVAQVDLLQTTYARFGIDAASLDYFVTHGTGTKLGDPIEANALNQVFQQAGAAPGSCAITSSKTNFGHTFAASGLLSLVNALQALRHQTIPAGLHCLQENDFIQWAESPLVVNKSNKPWPRLEHRPRRAGINAFGMSGTNATVVVRDHPIVEPEIPRPAALLLVLSAKTRSALQERINALIAVLEGDDAPDLTAAATTLLTGRFHFPFRCALVVEDTADALYLLRQSESGDAANLLMAEVPRRFKGQAALQRTCDDLLRGCRKHPDTAAVRENLLAAAALFCQGYTLDGSLLFGERTPRRIHLPGYAFARETYWLTSPKQESLPECAPAEDNGQWLFLREHWRDAAIPADFDWSARVGATAGQSFWIVADNRAAADALRDLLQHMSAAVSVPEPTIRVILLDEGPASLPSEAPDAVLWLGPERATETAVFAEQEVRRVLGVCRHLMEAFWGEAIRCIYIYKDTEDEPHLACEALPGLLRSAMMENENHRWQIIRHDGAEAQAAQILLREWLFAEDAAHPLEKSDIRYRAGLRQVRAFAEHLLPQDEKTLFRQGGVYVLAGGLGCLGGHLSRELASRYGATLVMLSRRPMDEAVQQQCAVLRDLGATVHCHAVDIADQETLAVTLAQVTAAVGPIHGVFNLARSHEDRMIAAKQWDSFQRVIQAKVQGTIHLDACTRDQPLDFFLCFSSLGAYGVRGSADYAYATAFQNAFTRHRARLVKAGLRHGVSLSQCWGAWVEDHLFPESRRAIQEQGFGLIDIDQGFPAIEASLSGAEGALLLMRVTDMPRVRGTMGLGAQPEVKPETPAEENQIAALIARWERELGDGGLPFETLNQHMTFAAVQALEPFLIARIHRLLFGAATLSTAASPQVPDAACNVPATQATPPKPTGAASPELRAVVREHLAAVLKLKQVDDDGPFPAYGLDSISATVLATRLEKALDRDLPVQWLVDHPTVQELVAQLQASAGKETR